MNVWMILAGLAALLVLVWLLLEWKTSRSDGTLLKVHPYRTMMTYIMPTRNESVVYFDSYVRADRLLAFVRETRESFHCDITHCVVAACAQALHTPEGSRMNRFAVGRRLYQRNGVWVSFSMKRKKLDREAKLAVVKEQSREGEGFAALCARINDKIGVERSDKRTYADKEFDLFLKLPRPILDRAFRFFKWLDYHNCLPASFIENDVMFTSVFIANLGSLNMAAGYHHLYEWGTCPLFVMVGRIEARPVVEDGEVVVREMMHLRYSYDERIDDGLSARFALERVQAILESPRDYLSG